MIDLNSYSQKALNIATKRNENEGLPVDVNGIIKYAAGELIEVSEAVQGNICDPDLYLKEDVAGEIADVMTCMLILSELFGINIEKALEQCQHKNYKRACEKDRRTN